MKEHTQLGIEDARSEPLAIRLAREVPLLLLHMMRVAGYLVFLAVSVDGVRWQLGYEAWFSPLVVLEWGLASLSALISTELIFWHMRRRVAAEISSRKIG